MHAVFSREEYKAPTVPGRGVSSLYVLLHVMTLDLSYYDIALERWKKKERIYRAGGEEQEK